MSRPFVAAAVALVVLAMSFSGADAQGCTITVGTDTFDLGPLAGEYSVRRAPILCVNPPFFF